MDSNKVISYIKSELDRGVSKENVYKQLLSEGWSLEDIESAFDDIKAEGRKGDIHKKTIRIILIIGAILIATGIFSFIAANWQGMSKTVKIIFIFVFMLSSHAAGWRLQTKYNYIKTGEILILLGSLMFGAGIFLIGQIFNIRANWPDGFILWTLGVLFMAYILDSVPQYALAILLGIISFVSYPTMLFELSFSQNLLTSSFLLLVTTVVIITIGLLVRSKMPDDLRKFY